MAMEQFRRVRREFVRSNGSVLSSSVCGVLAGASVLGWMVLLVLLVGLLANQGRLNVDTVEGLEFARSLGGEELQVGDENLGLLPVAVESRDRWYGKWIASLYQQVGWTARNTSCLAGLLITSLLLAIFHSAMVYWQSVLVAEMSTNAEMRMQEAVFEYNTNIESEVFQSESNDRIDPLLKEKIPTITHGVRAWLDSFCRDSATILLLIVFILSLNLWLGISFLLLAPLVVLAGNSLLGLVARRRRRMRETDGSAVERLLGLASKLRLIKGYAAEDFFREEYQNRLQHYQRDQLKRLRYEARVSPIWQVMGALLAVIVIGLGGQNVLTGKFEVFGAVGVYASLAALALPTLSLVRARRLQEKADAAAVDLHEFLSQPAEAAHLGRAFLPPLSKTIDLRRLTHRSAAGKVLIDDVSIRIHAGQKIALMARTDEEMLAFAYLLTGLVEPSSGSIEIDGRDIRQVTLESLRAQICPVLQSDLLFPGTIRDNIGCGDPGFGLAEIMEAAKIAHAHHFIQKLPHGYECVVGESGFPLKRPEAFQIAIARAIVRDPAIVIVEEPNQSLDQDTKALLDDTMGRFFRSRTVIVLPHRVSSLRTADQVFLLDEGKLVACGTHRELIETNALYRHLEYKTVHHFAAESEAG